LITVLSHASTSSQLAHAALHMLSLSLSLSLSWRE
jgi:hypothetical protein